LLGLLPGCEKLFGLFGLGGFFGFFGFAGFYELARRSEMNYRKATR
jgi:hypothetical protein